MRTFIYAMEAEEVLEELGVNAAIGLYEKDASSRLAESGQSRLKPLKKRSLFIRIIEQFKDTLIICMLIAAVVSAIIGHEPVNAILIVILLIAGMIVNIINKNRINRIIRSLKDEASPQARVLREGEIKKIDVRDVVIGDIVVLNRGDIVPADLRLIETNRLRVDEYSVTGEDEWARKEANVVLETGAALDERFNIAYMGSIVTYGKGTGVAYAVGKNTEKGKNAIVTTESDESKTELQDNINVTVRTLNTLSVILCTIILIIGILYYFFEIGIVREIPDVVLISLTLAFVIAPRGISAIAPVIMAIGAQKIHGSNAIVKSLQSALTTGCSSVICTDKTGTLTKNSMLITRVADIDNIYEVTGVGYKSKGHVIAEIMITRNIALMSEIVVLCNDAYYDKKTEQISGDPTEGAMLVYGVKQGHDKHILDAARPRISEIPFDTTRKMMSTYNKDGGRVIMYTKGAAEEIINRSTYVYLDGEIVFMSDAVRAKLISINNDFASNALRVLACAYKVYDSEADIDNEEYDLIYVGMMGIADPLRKELLKPINTCIASGMSIKIITGDHKLTARAITQAFGITMPDDEILNSNEIDELSDEELQKKVQTVNVFTRVTAEQKLRIINAIKADESNMVVMTGDDLDDVPALLKADVAVAMGITGKDIVKETADVIICDDSFVSIISAIEQGRVIFSNIRKVFSFILTFNIGVFLLFFAAMVFGLPLPLAPTQLLLFNLLIGILPALAMGVERKETGILAERPRNTGESIINRRVLTSSITRSVFVFFGAFAAFMYGLYVAIAPNGTEQHVLAMSMCFFTLIISGLLVAYSAKTDAAILRSKTILRNSYLNITVLLSLLVLIVIVFIPRINSLYTLVALSADQVVICMLIILLTVLGFEISKLYSGK